MANKKIKKPKKKIGKSHLQFEIDSGMKLPDVIDWQEQEVMDSLSTYFKEKIKKGVRYVSMAEILELFGHEPEYHHKRQYFEIADISDDYEDRLGMNHNGIYYPMANYSYH
jgi:hypothetical protein